MKHYRIRARAEVNEAGFKIGDERTWIIDEESLKDLKDGDLWTVVLEEEVMSEIEEVVLAISNQIKLEVDALRKVRDEMVRRKNYESAGRKDAEMRVIERATANIMRGALLVTCRPDLLQSFEDARAGIVTTVEDTQGAANAP